MKVPTSSLFGRALAWAVSQVESKRGGSEYVYDTQNHPWTAPFGITKPWIPFAPHVCGGDAVPIIEREGINTYRHDKLNPDAPDVWTAHKVVPRKGGANGIDYNAAPHCEGRSMLEAAMRVFVYIEFGREVDVPDTLAR